MTLCGHGGGANQWNHLDPKEPLLHRQPGRRGDCIVPCVVARVVRSDRRVLTFALVAETPSEWPPLQAGRRRAHGPRGWRVLTSSDSEIDTGTASGIGVGADRAVGADLDDPTDRRCLGPGPCPRRGPLRGLRGLARCVAPDTVWPQLSGSATDSDRDGAR